MFLFCRGFKTLASHHGLHSASAPGILALDINVNNNSKILTGGSDKTATVFNKDDEQVLLKMLVSTSQLKMTYLGIVFQVVAILKGHTKKVSRVVYHPNGENTVITASHDSTVRVWDVPTSQTIKVQ